MNLKRIILLRILYLESRTKKYSTSQVKSWNEVPGPSILPFFKDLLHHLPGGLFYKCEGYEFHKKLFETFGKIVKMEIFSGRKFLYLFDPESAETVFRGENLHPVRPLFESMDFYRKVFKKHNTEDPTGLLTDQGEVWKKLRNSVNPVMLQPKIVSLYTKVIDEVACDMIERLKTQRDKNNMLKDSFSYEMRLWALESISAVALGRRLYCFSNTLQENSPENKLLHCIQNFFIVTEKLDFFPNIWKYYPTKTFKQSMQLQSDLERLCLYFITETLNENRKKDVQKPELSVLEKLMNIDEKVAVNMASDMLFAGVETTSNSVIASLYLLASNPEKQIKLREEITSQRYNGQYLKACIKESMRLLPVSPGSMRFTTKDYNLLGYHIPKNQCIIYPHHLLCLMESQYPRSLEFIPERWLTDKRDPLHYGHAHAFSYLPFGFGTRTCIGRRIVDLEMRCILARIIENFHVEWIGHPPKVKHTIITCLKGPYNFIFKSI